MVVRFTADATQYNRVIHSMTNSLAAFTRRVTPFGDALAGPFFMAAGGVTALGAALTASGIYAIKSAAEYERTAVALEVMTGSAAAARDMITQINQLAIESPFRTPELLEGAKQLKGFGFETGGIIDTLRNLGEVSAGTGTELRRIILAFGQIRVAGRLMGPELRQLVDAGVPMFEYLAKVMDKPVQSIKGMVEEGRVAYPEVVRAFNLMTKEGGLFGGLMDRQSKTVSGQWSAMVETVEVKLRDLAGAFFEGFGVRDTLTGWREWINSLGKDKASLVEFFRSMRRGVDTMMEYVRGIAIWIRKNQEIIFTVFKVVTALTALTVAIRSVQMIIALITMPLGIILSLMGTLLSVALGVGGAIITLATSFVSLLPFILPVAAAVLALVGTLKSLDALDFGDFADRWRDFGSSLVDTFTLAWAGMKDAFKAGDFALAAKIAFKAIEVAFRELIEMLHGEWIRFRFFISKSWQEGVVPRMAGFGDAAKDIGGGVFDLFAFGNPQKFIEGVQGGNRGAKIAEEVKDEIARLDNAMGRQIMEATDTEATKNARDELKKLRDQAAEAAHAVAMIGREMSALDRHTMSAVHAFQIFSMMDKATFLTTNEVGVPEGALGQDPFGADGVPLVLPPQVAAIFGQLATVMPEIRDAIKIQNALAENKGIPVPLMLTSEAVRMASSLRREMGKELDQGIGDAAGKFDHFTKRVGLINEAFRGVGGERQNAFMGVLGGVGIHELSKQGILTPAEHEFGLFHEFQNLRKWIGDDKVSLPRAVERGSVEAQDIINRAQIEQLSVEDQIRNTLLRAEQLQKEMRDYQKMTVTALEKILEERRRAGMEVGPEPRVLEDIDDG